MSLDILDILTPATPFTFAAAPAPPVPSQPAGGSPGGVGGGGKRLSPDWTSARAVRPERYASSAFDLRTAAALSVRFRVFARTEFTPGPRPRHARTTATLHLVLSVRATTGYHDQVSVIRGREQEMLLAGAFDEET